MDATTFFGDARSRYNSYAKVRGQRIGQWLSNCLSKERPDLHPPEEVDPFYDDSRVPAFETWLHEHWHGEE